MASRRIFRNISWSLLSDCDIVHRMKSVMSSIAHQSGIGNDQSATSGSTERVRLCSIYLRDLPQFFKRPRVENYRKVSRYFNGVISTTAEAHLPWRCIKATIRSVGPPSCFLGDQMEYFSRIFRHQFSIIGS